MGKGSTTCSASAMVLLFASIPEGLERRTRMLDFTHSRGRSRTVATTREMHGIQEVKGSTPFGSTIFAGLAF